MSAITKMTLKQKNWLINFGQKTKDHEGWLQFIRFGMPTLKHNDDVLIELIVNEAKRLNGVEDLETLTITDDIVRIFNKLNITLKITD